MFKSRSVPRSLLVLAGTAAIVVGACSSTTTTPAPSVAASQAVVATPAASATPEPTPLLTAAPVDASVPGPNGGQIIRWFVGLGAGGQPQQIQVQTDFVNKFNNDPAFFF